jgi:hypothetical protein
MFDGPIADLIYFLGGIIFVTVSILIIFFIIFGLIKIFKFINRNINNEYTQLPINTGMTIETHQ